MAAGDDEGRLKPGQLGRRTFLGLATLGGAAVVGAACTPTSTPGAKLAASDEISPAKHPDLIRVATVYTPYSSGLLPMLAQSFESVNPALRVEFQPTNDVFTPGINGDADLLIVHFFHVGQPSRHPGRTGSHTKVKGVIPGSGEGPGTGGGAGSGSGGGSGAGGRSGSGSGGGGHGSSSSVIPGSGEGGGTGGGGGPGSGVIPGSGEGHRHGNGSGGGGGLGTGAVASAALLPGNMTFPAGASSGTMTTGAFVLEGYGLWPMAVFANQAVLVGPVSDPAGVRGLSSGTEAVRRIASHGSEFLAAALDVRIDFLDQLLVSAAKVEQGAWYVRSTAVGTALLQEAARLGAYTVWGDESASLGVVEGKLEPLVTTDPVLQRTMVSIIVNPQRVAGVNAPGARSFQEYLTTPAAQAAVLDFREPGFANPTFWPAAATSA